MQKAGAQLQFALVALAFFFASIGNNVYRLLPKHFELVAFEPSTIGFIMGAAPLGGLLVLPFLVPVIDRFSSKRLLTSVILGEALVGALYLCDFPLNSLYAVPRFLQGVLMGALITGFNATVSRAVSQEKRSSRFSLFQLMGPLGSLMGVSVGEPLYDAIGLWAVYLFSLGAYLWAAGVLVLRAGSREGRAGNGASGEAEQFTLATFRTILRRPNALVLGVWVLVLGAAMGTMMNFIPKAALDAGLTRIRPFFIAYPAAVIAVRLVSSRLLDHVHKRHAIPAPLLILPVTLWLAPEVTTPFQLAVAGAAYGLCHGVLSPVLVATFLSQAPESFQGRMSLLFQMLFNLGTFAATNLGGWLAEASLGWAFRSVGLFALVGTGLLLVMWRRPMFAGDSRASHNTHGKEHV